MPQMFHTQKRRADTVIRFIFILLIFITFSSKANDTLDIRYSCETIGGQTNQLMNYKYELELKSDRLTLHNSYVSYKMVKDQFGTNLLLKNGRTSRKDVLHVRYADPEFISATETFKTSAGEMVLLQAMYQIDSGLLVLQEVYSTELSDKTPTISSRTTELKCGVGT